MKEYKVLRVRYNSFRANSISEKVEETINAQGRNGWMFEQLEVSQMGVFVVLSRPKMR